MFKVVSCNCHTMEGFQLTVC